MKTKILNFARKLLFMNPIAERILVKAVTGHGFESWITKLLPNSYQYKKNSFRPAVRNGIRYKLDVSNLMEWVIYYPIREESKTRLFSRVNRGDVVLDVGTHIGEHLLNFAKHAGPKGEVHGFEPDFAIFNRCQENISLNDFANIRLNNFGLSDKEEELKIFCVNEHNLGMNRIIPDVERDQVNANVDVLTERGTIRTKTLDDYVKEAGMSRIDLVKIDVEGFEHRVILGGLKTLREFRPLIFIEIANENLLENDTSAEALLKEIENLGYGFKDAETMENISLPLDKKYIEPMRNNNFFCVPS